MDNKDETIYYLDDLDELLFSKNPLQKCIVTYKENEILYKKEVMVGTTNKEKIKKGVWCQNSYSMILYKKEYYLKVSEINQQSSKPLDRIYIGNILKMEFEDVIFEKVQEKNCEWCGDNDSICEVCKKVIICEECYRVVQPFKDDHWYTKYTCTKCAQSE